MFSLIASQFGFISVSKSNPYFKKNNSVQFTTSLSPILRGLYSDVDENGGSKVG